MHVVVALQDVLQAGVVALLVIGLRGGRGIGRRPAFGVSQVRLALNGGQESACVSFRDRAKCLETAGRV